MDTPSLAQARDFYRSPAFLHGLVIVDSLDSALEQVEYSQQFYSEGMFCGSFRQIASVKHDHRQSPFSVCLRAHREGKHGWSRDDQDHQRGQSHAGREMAREMIATLTDRDVARSLTHEIGLELPTFTEYYPDWTKGFQW